MCKEVNSKNRLALNRSGCGNRKTFFRSVGGSVPLLVILFSFFLVSASPRHDYHVSVTQMQYNPAQKLFEVSIRIFTDDLERGLSQQNNNRTFTIKNDDRNDQFVERYIQKAFLLVNSQRKPEQIRYLGKELEEDATWVYLEIPFPGSVEGYKLQNTILMEVFDDQVNMTNLKLVSEKKTFLFKKGQPVHPL